MKNVIQFFATIFPFFIIFVIDNLYTNYKKDGISCEKLCNVFHLYLTMYMKLRQESFTDMGIMELEVL